MNLKLWLSLLIFLTSLITISVIIHSNGVKLFFPVKATTFAKAGPKRWKSFGSEEWGPSIPRRSKNYTGPGYILVAEYADQMTGASFSILSLQCWAGAINPNMKVVEPFLYTGSGFGYTLNPKKGVKHHDYVWKSSNQVKLGDIFNLKKWHKQLESTGSIGNSFAMLESWKGFQKSAPRNLIVVGQDCNITELSTCNNKFYKSVESFAAKKGFRIVRKLEIRRKIYSFNEFANHIYGPLNPSEVVVFFRQWGGIVTKALDRRYTISGINQCLRERFRNFLFETSEKVLRDSSKYTSSYLSGSGTKYISVMLRFERFGQEHFRGANSQDEKMAAFAECQQAIKREVRNMQAIHNKSGLFLAMDARKHGSRGLRIQKNLSPTAYMDNVLLDTITRQMFDALRPYGNVIATVEEWEASFDNISSILAPGYVAQMQKNLAASGMCLVTAGGGSFQKSARQLYRSKHSETQRRCVIDVMECS